MYQLGCENLCFFLSERRLKGGVGVFPWEASERQDRGGCAKINTFQNQRKEAPDMAVFRIEKAKDYTVMSNYHLRCGG